MTKPFISLPSLITALIVMTLLLFIELNLASAQQATNTTLSSGNQEYKRTITPPRMPAIISINPTMVRLSGDKVVGSLIEPKIKKTESYRSNGEGYTTAPSAQKPEIVSVDPDIVHVGNLPISLTVYGNNFMNGATVYWNGSARQTTFISANELRVTIVVQDIALPGVATLQIRNLTGGPSNSVSVYIKYATTLNITSHIPNPSLASQPITVSYSITYGSRPTGIVKVYDVNDTSSSCTGTVTTGNCSLTLKIPGTRILIAEYGGDTNNDKSKTGVLHTVKGDTTTTLSASPNPATTIDPIVFTATVNSKSGGGIPTGKIILKDGPSILITPTLSNGVAVFSTTLTSGTHSITAAYNGDAIFNPSLSTPVTILVNYIPSPPVIISVDPNPFHVSGISDSMFITMTVTGGNFANGATVKWNGADRTTGFVAENRLEAVISKQDLVSTGVVTVSVENPDDSISNLVYIPIKYATITNITSDNPDPSSEEQSFPVFYTVSGSSPTGFVKVYDRDDSSVICTNSVAAGNCNITPTVGIRTLVAQYLGNSNNDVSTSSEITHTVKRNTTATLSISPNPAIETDIIILTATLSYNGASNSCTGDVQFFVGNNLSEQTSLLGIASIFNNKAVLSKKLLPGTYYIASIYGGDLLCNSSPSNPAPVQLTVEPQPALPEVFLPLIASNLLSAPDLVIASLTPTSNNVQIVIKNQGNAPAQVVPNLWVDAYFNPSPVPTKVNQLCEDLGGRGMIWNIQAALPLNPGATLTLNYGDEYQRSEFYQCQTKFPLTHGTLVCAQIDSLNWETSYGFVLETHEINGTSYNNIKCVMY